MKRKLRGQYRVASFIRKRKKEQKGGFISLIIAALTAIGLSAETAAVAAPIVAGATGAVASGMLSKVGEKIVGGRRRRRRLRI